MNTVADRIASIVFHLCAALGAFGRRIAHPPQHVWLGTRCYVPIVASEPAPPVSIPAWNLFIARIRRTARRIQVLFTAWQNGTLKPPRPRPNRATPRTATPRLRLPRAFGWANLRAREVRPIAGLLDTLLQEAPSQTFLAEVPRAARLVRPLCQALGVQQPAWLKLPPRPRKPRPKKPRPDRPLPLTDPRLGLQPYVIAAARHARKSDKPR